MARALLALFVLALVLIIGSAVAERTVPEPDRFFWSVILVITALGSFLVVMFAPRPAKEAVVEEEVLEEEPVSYPTPIRREGQVIAVDQFYSDEYEAAGIIILYVLDGHLDQWFILNDDSGDWDLIQWTEGEQKIVWDDYGDGYESPLLELHLNLKTLSSHS